LKIIITAEAEIQCQAEVNRHSGQISKVLKNGRKDKIEIKK